MCNPLENNGDYESLPIRLSLSSQLIQLSPTGAFRASDKTAKSSPVLFARNEHRSNTSRKVTCRWIRVLNHCLYPLSDSIKGLKITAVHRSDDLTADGPAYKSQPFKPSITDSSTSLKPIFPRKKFAVVLGIKVRGRR